MIHETQKLSIYFKVKENQALNPLVKCYLSDHL